jgi:hypothetical protein
MMSLARGSIRRPRLVLAQKIKDRELHAEVHAAFAGSEHEQGQPDCRAIDVGSGRSAELR